MTHEEILECFNDCVRAQERSRAGYDHVAIEIPSGEPQIAYHELSASWAPRGDVLRCVIEDSGPRGEPVVYIDEVELSWREFGRLLATFAGWGVRIVFVPDDRIEEEPTIEVRLPREHR